jgi:hypothetical protein
MNATQTQNIVLESGYSAVVDGQETGLSGCSNPNCKMACLRKDTRLRLRHDYNRRGTCKVFIPIVC